MQDFFTHFHFLRPLWLLAIVPAILLCLLLWKQKSQRSQWQEFIPSELLQHLLDRTITQTARWQLWGVGFGWVITCLALSGPTWEKLPLPLHQSQSAVVIVLDLSPSMVAADIKPSRLIRARYKLTDFLEQRSEGLTALVAYAGEAHVVSPLTDDVDTITNLLTALSPNMMPLRGSNIEMGIDKAIQLFKDSGIAEGQILVVTDNINSSAIPTIKKSLLNTSFELSILGVGTVEGAPIPFADGGFAKDRSDNIVIAKLNQPELIELANSLNGIYTPLRSDNQDLKLINSQTNNTIDPTFSNTGKDGNKIQREFDDWKDQGHLLAILLLPLIALCFRRGWLLSLACLVLFIPEPSYAFGWDDLWLRSDQQGQKSLANNDAETAAQQFKNPGWRGAAQYRNKDYEAAAESFSHGESIKDFYNHGNALAKAGKLSEAIQSYEKSLELFNDINTDNKTLANNTPPKENIEFNKSLVEKLLKQQEQKQDQGKEQDGKDKDSSDNKDSKNNKKQDDDTSSDSDQASKDQDYKKDNRQQKSGDQQKEQSSEGNPSQDKTDEDEAQKLADQQLAGEEKDQENKENQKEQQQKIKEANRENQTEDSEQKNKNDKQMASVEDSTKPTNEEQQALEQWLRQVPDDPSGLLRRKFEYQHRQLRQQYQRGEWTPPENDAAERW